MTDDGRMARLPELQAFAREHGLGILTIRDLIEYRRRSETLVERVADGARCRPRRATFQRHRYASTLDGEHHVALVLGDVAAARGRCSCASTPSA